MALSCSTVGILLEYCFCAIPHLLFLLHGKSSWLQTCWWSILSDGRTVIPNAALVAQSWCIGGKEGGVRHRVVSGEQGAGGRRAAEPGLSPSALPLQRADVQVVRMTGRF